MANKGFNISDLVGKGAKLVIPSFLRDKGRFSKKNCQKTSEIASLYSCSESYCDNKRFQDFTRNNSPNHERFIR